MTGPILCRPRTNIHSCCEFMFAMTMSCQENGISQPFAPSWSSYILSTSSSLMFPEPYIWWYKSPVQLYTRCLLFPAHRKALSLHSLPFNVKRSFSFLIETESSIYLWAYAKCLEGKFGDMSIQLYNCSMFLVDPLKHRSLALPSYFCSSLYSLYLPQHPPCLICVHVCMRILGTKLRALCTLMLTIIWQMIFKGIWGQCRSSWKWAEASKPC